MAILLGIIILFAFIWIVVVAFKPNTKEITIKKIDPETGKEIIETRIETSGTAASTASRIVLITIAIFLLLLIAIVTILFIAGSV